MSKKKANKKSYLLLLGIALGFFLFSTLKNKKNNNEEINKLYQQEQFTKLEEDLKENNNNEGLSIVELTAEERVVEYVRKYKKLPDYYITKKQARELGWIPSKGNLCDTLPLKAIGGDVFENFEGLLPKEKNRQYYEADINYDCGKRGAERLVFSNDGLIFVTYNHYKTFQEPK